MPGHVAKPVGRLSGCRPFHLPTAADDEVFFTTETGQPGSGREEWAAAPADLPNLPGVDGTDEAEGEFLEALRKGTFRM